MQAFEFNSTVEGGIIKIPDKYLDQIISPVKVIVLTQDNHYPVYKKKFKAMSLDTRSFKFNRDKANER